MGVADFEAVAAATPIDRAVVAAEMTRTRTFPWDPRLLVRVN